MTSKKPAAAPLRALSHPLRIELLMEFLESDVPLRAADLCEKTGIADNVLSYHLRRLLGAGLIARADPPEGSTRRDKWYFIPPENIDLADVVPGDNPDLDAAISGVERQRYAWLAEKAVRAQAANDGPLFHSVSRVWLTPEQADRIVEILEDVSSLSAVGDEARADQGKRRFALALDLLPEAPITSSA